MEKKPVTSSQIGRRETYYKKWLKDEGVRVVDALYVEDVRTLELAPWERKGGKAAVVNLAGSEGAINAYVAEIPPGGSLKPEKHIFEEFIYVVEGAGATSVWNDPAKKQTFEWQTGSLFAPPLNAWHQLFNGSGSRPARYLAVTLAPPVLNLYRNPDFVFNNPYVFAERYDDQANYFSAEGKSLPGRIWESNFIADCRSFKLQEWKERGAGGSNIEFEISNNSMASHISEFPIGTYKKAHRHGPGAHILVLGGSGYSVMWPEEGSPARLNWHEGSLFAPPNQWFHQHLNTGDKPARYLALRRGSRLGTGVIRLPEVSIKEGGAQLEYEDEDPQVHKDFETQLSRAGVRCRMGALHPFCTQREQA